MSALLAIGWKPELRGILIVIIAVVVLCGSIYLILATNLGARLGFLVALQLGGEVSNTGRGEYGRTDLEVQGDGLLFGPAQPSDE